MARLSTKRSKLSKFSLDTSSLQYRTISTVTRASNLAMLIAYGLIFLSILLLFLLPSSTSDEIKELCLLLLALGIGTVGAVYYSPISNTLSLLYGYGDVIRAFARDNKLTFGRPFHDELDPLYYPAIKGLGSFAKYNYGAKGIIGTHDFAVFGYSWRNWLSYKESRPWLLAVSVATDQLLPHTVLQSRNSLGSRFATALPRTFDDNQRVSLQNDLDDFFLFYTHRRTVTEGLTLWSPTLLYELRKLETGLSIETIGRKVYFYIDEDNCEPKKVLEHFAAIETVIRAFDKQLKATVLRLPNDKKYPFLRSRPAGGVVQFAGKYWPYGLVYAGFELFRTVPKLYHAWKENNDYFWLMCVIFVAVWTVFLWFLFYARNQYTRTRDKRGI